jgi:PPOX class probable F420-dependent enzyme
VWADESSGDVLVNTADGRAKPRHMKDDPRVSIIMVDPADQYRWVAVTGRAALTTEGAREHIDVLAKKYLGVDEYPWHKEGEQRLTVRIKPEKVDSSGL